MKKVVCILLAVLMCMNGLAVALAENEVMPLELMYTTFLYEKSAIEWMDDYLNRALITLFLALDVEYMDDLPYYPTLTETSYIGRSGLNLIVITETNTDNVLLVIEFHPHTQEAAFSFYADIYQTEYAMEAIMSEICPNGYYSNDPAVLYEVYNEVMSALGLSGR